jgi:phosphohistidine swiveling domain-containing protein
MAYPSTSGRFEFGTKAETLFRLGERLGNGFFCEQIAFTVDEWRRDRCGVTDKCLGAFDVDEVVVRSSSTHEDMLETSMAGAFHSVVGVPLDPRGFAASVDAVIASYGDGTVGADQVLVQPRVKDVAIAGVVLTRDLDTGAPYYVINYDDETGRTDSVTGGAESTTVLVHRSRTDLLVSSRMRALIEAVKAIEAETADDCLDLEFCVTTHGTLYILQVRPLATRHSWPAIHETMIDRAIDGVRGALAHHMAPSAGLFGDTTVFGQMPDWNPAEMIGSRPKPFTYSLYRRLITSGAWAEARHRMGYRDMRGRDLMVRFAEQPFIDVRLSLNSFLPAGLDSRIGEKLVNQQIERLADNRDLHDKIEFEIAFPSYDFRFESRLGELRDAGLDASEIGEFRAEISGHTRGLIRDSRRSIEAIHMRLAQLDNLERGAQSMPPLAAAASMLEGLIPYGIVPFAEAARHAFIGVSFLKSFVHAGVLDTEDASDFLSSIETVAHELVRDMSAMQRGDIDRAAFLVRYGHLRPGTYDVTSYRYDEKPDSYLASGSREYSGSVEFALSERKRGAAQRLVDALEPDFSLDALFDYVRQVVQLRESAKFRFTRTVSEVLREISLWGEDHGFGRDALAFLPIDEILQHTDGPERLKDEIAAGREAHEVSRLVRLPHIISKMSDIDIVRLPLGKATFITQNQITASTVQLAPNEVAAIDGRIVMIESADPGFDWIFSHKIAGLITKYGGANSHMAIRCAEFRLPAAIGCGERLYNTLAHAPVVTLDCAAGTLTTS